MLETYKYFSFEMTIHQLSVYTLSGYIGSVVVSIVLIPQILKSYRLRDASQLSNGMLLLQLTGAICFLVFAIGIWLDQSMTDALPLVLGNSSLIIQTTILLCFKYKFK